MARAPASAAPDADPLANYQRMRDFAQTPEPAGTLATAGAQLQFVVQKHAASRLHYDFRLELDGTLKSWAVPKGPSLDPHDKRMAVQVEDHPLSYAGFEGTIPPGHYGAGTVIVWDRGSWAPLGDARAGLRDGKLKFDLHGSKLQGHWMLVRTRGRDADKQPPWLLIKEHDAHERPAGEFSVVDALPDSVLQPAGEAARVAKPARPVKASAATGIDHDPDHDLHGAVAAALPGTLAPQLAVLVDGIPSGENWLYEIKFDGYRLLTRIDGDDVRCYTRNGHDWSDRLPHLVAALRALKLGSGWLDGEIIVADAEGAPDFQALQNAFDSARTAAIVYCIFDLPYHAGLDLRAVPLAQRRARLAALLPARADGPLRLSACFDADPHQLLQAAQQAGLEGLIGKRAGSRYTSQRSGDWVKLKTRQRQEFVIGGYTDPQGSRTGLGALLLGLHNAAGALHYAGNVGTGFDEKTLHTLIGKLAPLEVAESPFVDAPARVGTVQKVVPHWVEPRLLAEVSFAQWTKEQRVRHAVFHGLRIDKPARAVHAELPRLTKASVNALAAPRTKAGVNALAAPRTKAGANALAAPPARAGATALAAPRVRAIARTQTAPGALAGIAISHPERVIDSASALTKGDLVAYYARVAPLLLPHLLERPVALLRAPGGVGGQQFFQKHAEESTLPHVDVLDPALDPDHPPLLAIHSAQGLVSAAQMNTIELHTWNATTRAIAKPDRMVFDLDPGEGVAWPQIQQAAQLVRGFLDELPLRSFLKTSGGKGLHVVVPLQPRLGWTAVKAFSQAIVAHIAQVLPDRFVAKSGPSNRIGKVYIDYLRNGFGATTAAAWSARARPGLGISVPLTWDELPKVPSGAAWTVANAAEREPIGNMPWSGYEAARQSLAPAMKRLGFKATQFKD